MKIANASTTDIAALMGNSASLNEAARMIDALNARGIEDTNDLTDAEWFALVAEVIA